MASRGSLAIACVQARTAASPLRRKQSCRASPSAAARPEASPSAPAASLITVLIESLQPDRSGWKQRPDAPRMGGLAAGSMLDAATAPVSGLAEPGGPCRTQPRRWHLLCFIPGCAAVNGSAGPVTDRVLPA